MLTAIVIDDESDSIEALKELLTEYTSIPVKVIGTANNLENGIKLIHSGSPDIVFLDINMPNESGMDIYKFFAEPKFKVIFITAYSQYAIEALKKSASDYLLKPVNFIELNDALKKVTAELKKEQQNQQLQEKLTQISAPEMHGRKIILDTEHGFIVENTKNIEYCVADQSYSFIITNLGRKIVVSKPLKYLEELLPANQFYRTHKSYLVNIHYIKQFIRADENHVLLTSGEKIPVSVRKSSELEQEIKRILSEEK